MAPATQKDKSHYLPGQTKELDENASDGQALKIFYTTLYKEKPQSELAAKWLLQHGLHDDKETALKAASMEALESGRSMTASSGSVRPRTFSGATLLLSRTSSPFLESRPASSLELRPSSCSSPVQRSAVLLYETVLTAGCLHAGQVMSMLVWRSVSGQP